MSAVTPSCPAGVAAPALVQFQLGLFREVVRVPAGNLSYRHARRLAAEVIERKAPDCSVVGVGEKILLFRHQPVSEQLQLQRLTDIDELQDGDLIEVVVAGSASVTQMRMRPHSLVVQSYRTPTFCHHCGEMLWGLVRQGLKCDGKSSPVVGRVARAPSNVCTKKQTNIKASSPSPLMSKTSGAQVPHTFHIHSYTKPTVCQHCHRLLRGLFRQGLQCSDCRFNCHRRCEPLVPRDCPGERRGDTNGEGGCCCCCVPPTHTHSHAGSSLIHHSFRGNDSSALASEEVNLKTSHFYSLPVSFFPPASPCFSSNIPLMRLVQSVHHTKRRAGGVLREGWLLHRTNTDSLRKRHYWIVDWKSITLYQDESSIKYYKEIPLSEVLQVRGPGQLASPPLPGDAGPSFEVVTASLVYCVLAGADGPLWESAIRQGLMPVENNKTLLKTYLFTVCSFVLQDVSSMYQIFTDEVLGSGQFGVVYRGTHRKSGRPVAIKVIDKTRFPARQETQLRNEVSILQNLSHLGVVLVEGMFESVQHVFVVMEKLHGDMLEMILSSEKGRLPERNTRFLVTQILEALRYLHLKHIAHCDLKPENVLLASADPFPLVKLCDFGFARIIGEKSFRRSVVGTPAYLAPEVISSSGYNRSLDMWSAGVIMYVSLSGTFPFNEDEDVRQQITNASFMYPRQPWASVSLEAVSLINNLLQVSLRRRFSVGKALGHPWLQDFQLWCDLRGFEQRMGCRYLTHRADEERWTRLARERGLDFPAHLCWDPDNEADA
uniref:protein kinase C n=1 Tax=Scophthalmus maximus TaxID=52904 RepID=A0A8D3C9X9_SCOMX